MSKVDHVSDWHGIQAARCWNKGDIRGFKRHTRIADEGWAKSGVTQASLSARLQHAHSHEPTAQSVFGTQPTRRRDQHVVVLINGKPVQVTRKGSR